MKSHKANVPDEALPLINTRQKSRIMAFGFACSLILLICLTTNMGEARVSFEQVIRIIFGKLTFQPALFSDISNGFVSIIWDIRLPRILSAVLIGAGLSVSGAIFQSLLMNPLADPYTQAIYRSGIWRLSLNLFFRNSGGYLSFCFTGSLHFCRYHFDCGDSTGRLQYRA